MIIDYESAAPKTTSMRAALKLKNKFRELVEREES